MSNMCSFDIWHLGSDMVTPRKEAPSLTQRGVGSDDNLPLGNAIQIFLLLKGDMREKIWEPVVNTVLKSLQQEE